jgi:hypothetical protein
MTSTVWKPTFAQLKGWAKQRGYMAKKTDGEYEIYPKGGRGDRSYFTNCTKDAADTLKVEFAWAVRRAYQEVAQEHDVLHVAEIEDAILALIQKSGLGWITPLEKFCVGGWNIFGPKDAKRSDRHAAIQRFRNWYGSEWYVVAQQLHKEINAALKH